MKIFAYGLVAGCIAVSTAQANKDDAADPSKVDADYALQGDYVGTIKEADGEARYGTQVIALGNGKFRAVGYTGGLPGDGWNGEKPERVEASLKDGEVRFVGAKGSGVLKDGKLLTLDKAGRQVAVMNKVERKSPTLGAKPPEGALVLFDGTSADNFKPGRMTEDGLLIQRANSKERFQSHQLHLEFRLPYQPTKRGQGRGNSGAYLQGRYEVQMLDS
ncbi:MAG: family 16 glycoside hydrolase [Verrucomicrobiota bacterium]